MSYEDIVEAQRKRDAREVDRELKAASKTKHKAQTLTMAARKKPRSSELEDAKRNVKAPGLGQYCSVLQF